jgi:hypothetical protein
MPPISYARHHFPPGIIQHRSGTRQRRRDVRLTIARPLRAGWVPVTKPFEAFGPAVRRKLVREIAHAPPATPRIERSAAAAAPGEAAPWPT